MGLGVVPLAISALVLFCDNSGGMAQFKEPRNHRKGKHIVMKHYLICETIIHEKRCGCIASMENLIDPL